MTRPATSPIRLAWEGRTPFELNLPEVRLIEQRSGSEHCSLVQGDNLLALSAIRSQLRAQVALAYLDPPFFTGREHSQVRRSRNGKTGEISRQLTPAFDDRWQDLRHYLSVLSPRVHAVRELLAPHGCLVLHVDSKTSHYAKVICDEIFGPECFASEIIWRYRRWPSKTRNFQRVHDVLLRYVRDPGVEPRFTQLYEPLAASTLATWGDRKQRAVVDARGRRQCSSRTGEPTPGTPLGDVWDVSIIAPVARERTGYPTQKPEALLERLITACTEPDDLVLDPYVGSGTTLAVAQRLGRRGVGIDIGDAAIQTARQRLLDMGVRPREYAVRSGTPRRARRSAAVADVA